MISELWVLWKAPAEPIPDGVKCLSYLSPAEEFILRKNERISVISAREASRAVRKQARETYLNISAGIGVAADKENRTFRERLRWSNDECSDWWFHPASFKNCEDHPVYEWMIAVFTIRHTASGLGLARLRLFGAPEPVASVLRRELRVEETATARSPGAAGLVLRGVLSRIKYLFTTLRLVILSRRCNASGVGRPDVVLSGLWSESLSWDFESRAWRDKYFRELPEELRGTDGVEVGWFVWLHPQGRPILRKSIKAWLAPLSDTKRVIVLHRFLGLWEVTRTLFSFRALLVYIGWSWRGDLRAAFQSEGVGFEPLFRELLLKHFAGMIIPHHRLIVLATRRATLASAPKVTVSYLEHYPFSRAHYSGVHQAQRGTKCVAMQHASACRDTTLYYLDPIREFLGAPDNCTVPHPEKVFAMGQLGYEVFREMGYSKDQVTVSGSARYGYVQSVVRSRRKKVNRSRRNDNGCLNLLVAGGLAEKGELDLIEAVCKALEHVEGYNLLLRLHPLNRIEHNPRLRALEGQFERTRGSLESDLNRADVVLYTYSTVGDEAYIAGLPTWQWLPLGFNGSALAEVADIPQFATVEALIDALELFRKSPESYLAGDKELQEAVEQLFGQADGKEVSRIREGIKSLMEDSVADPRGRGKGDPPQVTAFAPRSEAKIS